MVTILNSKSISNHWSKFAHCFGWKMGNILETLKSRCGAIRHAEQRRLSLYWGSYGEDREKGTTYLRVILEVGLAEFCYN